MCIYIYIERERDVSVYIYIYTHHYYYHHSYNIVCSLSYHHDFVLVQFETHLHVCVRVCARISVLVRCWVFIKGGCSRRGVQWMGVVLYNKTVYNIM